VSKNLLSLFCFILPCFFPSCHCYFRRFRFGAFVPRGLGQKSMESSSYFLLSPHKVLAYRRFRACFAFHFSKILTDSIVSSTSLAGFSCL
jgi:hypothetical protein